MSGGCGLAADGSSAGGPPFRAEETDSGPGELAGAVTVAHVALITQRGNRRHAFASSQRVVDAVRLDVPDRMAVRDVVVAVQVFPR